MSKYAQAAVDIAQRCQSAESPDLKYEWDKAMLELYPNQKPARKKSCPKNAFLGLCETGMVTGIDARSYGVSQGNLNKKYAVEAAHLILEGLTNKKALWETVCGGEKTPNSQVDIVLAIHAAGLLTAAPEQS